MPGGDQDDEARLIAKLRKIEALFSGATTPGERDAAAEARTRVQARLQLVEPAEPLIEMQFSLQDPWSRRLFIALLRRYEIRPYRLRGQRRTTVMARITRTLLDKVLWPEYLQLDAILRDHLEAVTTRIIAEAVHADTSEPSESSGSLTGA